jgi:anti-sigma regulatory factor (Ser/Thr protein kinase)
VQATAEFLSDQAELARLEAFTAEFATRAGLGDKDLFALQIVVEELVSNVIFYGGVPPGEPAARVDLAVEDGEVVMRLTDRGREFNPLERAAPDTTLPAEQRPIGGLGIHFCKKLTDAQRYERADGRNVLELRRKLRG